MLFLFLTFGALLYDSNVILPGSSIFEMMGGQTYSRNERKMIIWMSSPYDFWGKHDNIYHVNF